MGTRHLICVFNKGEYRVAQYGQWDGYPSGQGVDILKFLSEKENIEKLREHSLMCSFITEEERLKLFQEYGLDETELSSQKVARFLSDYPQFSRDTSASLLKIIAESNSPVKLDNYYDFSADSLFCEWAYVIDFDKNTFEVYKGFCESSIAESERFYTGEKDVTYYPVRLITSFDLSRLPQENDFLNAFGEDE